MLSEKSMVKDYQEIKVQEKLDLYSAGSLPRSAIAILEDDLVDACKPGDDVTIVYEIDIFLMLWKFASIFFVYQVQLLYRDLAVLSKDNDPAPS